MKLIQPRNSTIRRYLMIMEMALFLLILDMNTVMIVPPGFDPSGTIKYPVLMHVYGGPDSQIAKMQPSFDFMHAVTALNVIGVTVDGRGSGWKGRAFRDSVASNLGSVEVEDQIAAAKWLAKQAFIDGKKIGIWGWSYGGYLTSKVVEANSGAFSLAMAVAPVTDWMLYDTVYTERFMKTPTMNPDGYKKSAVRKMEGFKHIHFLMIHGTADDNVHFQNSADLVWHLTGAGITDYTSHYYTDSDHSIYANGANSLVYKKLTNFMCQKWELNCQNS